MQDLEQAFYDLKPYIFISMGTWALMAGQGLTAKICALGLILCSSLILKARGKINI